MKTSQFVKFQVNDCSYENNMKDINKIYENVEMFDFIISDI